MISVGRAWIRRSNWLVWMALAVLPPMRFLAYCRPARFVLIHLLVIGLGLSGTVPRVMACSTRCGSSASTSSCPSCLPQKIQRTCCCGAPNGQCCKMACCRTAPVRQPAAPPARGDSVQRIFQTLAILPLSTTPALEQGSIAAQHATSGSGDGPVAVTLQRTHVRIQA